MREFLGNPITDENYEVFELIPITVQKNSCGEWKASFKEGRITAYDEVRRLAILTLFKMLLENYDFLSTGDEKELSYYWRKKLKILAQHIRQRAQAGR